MEIRASFSHQNQSANGQFHSVHFDEMADTGHLHKKDRHAYTEFLFMSALEIQVSNLGDTPYGSRRISILTPAASKNRSSRAGCCPAAAARR